MEGGYDAILIVGFGGPEGRADVIPFLGNVLCGRNVPRERMLQVAEHYYQFGGVSPINSQARELMAALRPELDRHGISLPMYWGNRNWHPLLPDAMRQMAADGVRKAVALVLAAYSSYSSCRQYREDIERARADAGPDSPPVDKLRVFYNHPEFVAAGAERVEEALASIPDARRGEARIAYTAHSIPHSMAETSDYEQQLQETCRLVSESLQIGADRYALVYQSRSGRPQDPWLEPDILDHLQDLQRQGVHDVVVAPVGFLSDHMEILYDLDHEAQQRARDLGLNMVRAGTVGTHPRFVAMLRELIEERLGRTAERRAVGRFGANHDVCPVGCCPSPPRAVSAREGEAPAGPLSR